MIIYNLKSLSTRHNSIINVAKLKLAMLQKTDAAAGGVCLSVGGERAALSQLLM